MDTFRESYFRSVDNMGGVAGTFASNQYLNDVREAVD